MLYVILGSLLVPAAFTLSENPACVVSSPKHVMAQAAHGISLKRSFLGMALTAREAASAKYCRTPMATLAWFGVAENFLSRPKRAMLGVPTRYPMALTTMTHTIGDMNVEMRQTASTSWSSSGNAGFFVA